MIVQDIFKRCIESRINKNIDISEERKKIELERIIEWSKQSDIFREVEDDESFEFNTENFSFEGNFLPMGEFDEEREKRIEGWIKYYESQPKVFEADEERGEYGRTALHLAIVRGDLEEFKRLMDTGSNYELEDGLGYNGIQLAIVEDQEEILGEFKRRGIV